ncbi:MAG: DUF1801 domain-containing protein [Bacteroidota bacterium]
MQHLHDILSQIPAITISIKWKIPYYSRKHPICYLNPLKNKEGIELCFYRGQELSNENGLLKTKGRKMIAGIEIYNPDTAPWLEIEEVIHEAVFLDENVKYVPPTIKKK